MSDITVHGSTYDRLKRDADAYRELARMQREQGEAAGIAAIRAGRKKEGLMAIGGANAPAIQAVIAGAGLYWLAVSDFTKNLPLFKDHWWAKPLAILGGGYWLYRKGNPWAVSIMSTGAALFVAAWKTRPESKEEAKGPEEAGWWREGASGEPDYHDAGRWLEAPSGARVFAVDAPSSRAAERMAERIFEHAKGT
jgi:hypothetical protein